MGTIRLGKRTDKRSPLIKDFVPLAGLEDLVFGGWDIFEDNAYEAALKAGVLERPLLDAGARSRSATIKPMKAVFDHEYVKRHRRAQREDRRHQDGLGRDADGRHPAVQENDRRGAPGHDLVRVDRSLPSSRPRCTPR